MVMKSKEQGNKVIVLLVVKDKETMYATLVNDNDWSDQKGYPFFACVIERNYVFEEALVTANFRLLALWAKDSLNLDHKKITLKFCPTLNKLAGSRKKQLC